MLREKIIKDLKEHLSKLNHNIEIFEVYVFDKESLPLIVIKDTNDDVEAANFEGLRHNLSISLNLITTTYEKSDALTAEVLQSLKDFSGEFNFKSLDAINRASIEILDKDYVLMELKLSFVYHSRMWSY